MLKNDQDIPDWWNIMGEMFKKLQTSKNLCEKRGFTGTEPLRITVGSHGMIQCPFYCHHIKAECLGSFLSFYRLQNTQVVCQVWKFAFNGCSHLVFLGRVNIEVRCQQEPNFILPEVCQLIYWHDIDIIIMKYWLVFQDIC